MDGPLLCFEFKHMNKVRIAALPTTKKYVYLVIDFRINIQPQVVALSKIQDLGQLSQADRYFNQGNGFSCQDLTRF